MNTRQILIGPNLYRWAILDEEIMLWFVYTTDHRAFNKMFWQTIEKHGML